MAAKIFQNTIIQMKDRIEETVGITDDRLVFYANSSCIKSNGKQNEIVDELLVYDTSGNQTSHIYLKDIFRNICESSRVRIESVTKENRLYTCLILCFINAT